MCKKNVVKPFGLFLRGGDKVCVVGWVWRGRPRKGARGGGRERERERERRKSSSINFFMFSVSAVYMYHIMPLALHGYHTLCHLSREGVEK